MSHLRAALVLAVMAVLFIVGTPGLDHLGGRLTPKEEARLQQKFGSTVGAMAESLMRFNQEVRIPLAKKLGGFQPIFRIRQAWNLYRDGPRLVYKLEVHVDGEVVFRSKDNTHDWLAPQLTNRRLRPVVESTTKKFKSANWRGLSRFVVAAAREEWPHAQKVELVAMRGKRPGAQLKESHRITAQAPQWTPEKTR